MNENTMRKLREVRAFVASDSMAITYQSLVQYRQGLLKYIDATLATPDTATRGADALYDLMDVEAAATRAGISEYGRQKLAYELRQEYFATPVQATAPRDGEGFDFFGHLCRQRAWSERTFGPGDRAKGVVDHIRKELREIEADPADLSEWIDVVILALDGAWRSGADARQIIEALVAKQTKNEGRAWPDWRTMPADRAIEHDRSRDEQPLERGVIVRYASGSTAIARLLEPHAGGWHALQCLGGITFVHGRLPLAEGDDLAMWESKAHHRPREAEHFAPPAAQASETVLCSECAQPTMHMGSVCYACSHPATPPHDTGTERGEAVAKPQLPASAINALPQVVREYIAWIETNADPAGTIQENWRLTQENAALRQLADERGGVALLESCITDEKADWNGNEDVWRALDGVRHRFITGQTAVGTERAVWIDRHDLADMLAGTCRRATVYVESDSPSDTPLFTHAPMQASEGAGSARTYTHGGPPMTLRECMDAEDGQ